MKFMSFLIGPCLFFALHASAVVRPNFEKVKIKIGSKNLEVELADTPEKNSFGLMYQKSLKENDGMLFVFQREQILSFWMKNTFVDLSLAYIDSNFRVIDFHDMKASKSEMQTDFTTYQSRNPAQYALEMRLGWFKKNGIKVGDKLIIFIKK